MSFPKKYDENDSPSSIFRDKWSFRDVGWLLNLFGTAIGAGILYLPIAAGTGGIWPLIILSVIAGPIVWLTHRNLVRFCLSSSRREADITETMQEHFGSRIGGVLNWIYCLSSYPILLLYSIGITDVILHYLKHQMAWQVLPSRLWLSISLIAVLVILMHMGEKWILRCVSIMVYPLAIILLLISFYLIPYWNMSVFSEPFSFKQTGMTLLLTMPLVVFSFNHSPCCSSFVQAYRLLMTNKEACARKVENIIKYNVLLLLVVVLFFVFSCLLSMTPNEFSQAKAENLPVLSVLGQNLHLPLFSLLVPWIALLAMISSFFGVYMGAFEAIKGITSQYLIKNNKSIIKTRYLSWMVTFFILLTCWLAADANWSIINAIAGAVAPMVAIILFVMPIAVFYKVSRLSHYKNKWVDLFTLFIGFLAIFGFFLNKIL